MVDFGVRPLPTAALGAPVHDTAAPQFAEVPRALFATILRRIDRLRGPPLQAA